MLYIVAVSDSIGETAMQVAKAAASQFNEKIEVKRVSYIKSLDDVDLLIEEVKQLNKVLLVSTIVIVEVREYLMNKARENSIRAINVLSPVIEAYAELLNTVPAYSPGAVRNIDEDYFKKIEAIEFAIQYDDSKDYRGLKNADVVLIGLSRTSKTPLCMCLADKGIKAINIPLVPEVELPKELFEIDRRKIFCLTIDPLELIEIRKKRIGKYKFISSKINYAGEERILEEFEFLDKIIKKIRCKTIDVTKRAIEDTAAIIEDNVRNKL